MSGPAPLPPWPAAPPAHGDVVLRAFERGDVALVRELSTDPYVPQVTTLPPSATGTQALAWIERQRGRWADGVGYSFAVAEAGTGTAVGQCGLWPTAEPPRGRASAGYAREGLVRRHQEIGGERRDVLLFPAARPD
jgi:[ribosomal protein S5]-alanine N-acetyltransferase